jgi:ribosomal protein L44E
MDLDFIEKEKQQQAEQAEREKERQKPGTGSGDKSKPGTGNRDKSEADGSKKPSTGDVNKKPGTGGDNGKQKSGPSSRLGSRDAPRPAEGIAKTSKLIPVNKLNSAKKHYELIVVCDNNSILKRFNTYRSTQKTPPT